MPTHSALIIAAWVLWATPLAGEAVAATIRVPGDQPTIEAGIIAAGVGDTVLVAPGTYTGSGNKDLDFGGRDLVLRAEAGPEQTIIDCEGTAIANARGLIFENGESKAARVSGFTIRNGYRSGGTYRLGFGAGIFITSAGTDPTIENCVFEGNVAETGGGLAAGDGAAPRILGCAFYDNRADFGGGGAFVDGSARFSDCAFSGNRAAQIGGAILCFSGGAPTFTGCTIRGNDAGSGGAISCEFPSAPTFDRCRIEDNVALSDGSAVHCVTGASAILNDCILSGNIGQSTFQTGAVIYCAEAMISLAGCTFYANSSSPGGCLHADQEAMVTVENSIIAFGTQGGAVSCAGTGSVTLVCSDLHGNAGGDWTPCVAAQQGVNGNLEADPRFCNPALGDLGLDERSPCAPAQSGGCGQVGALGVNCMSAVERSTWGAIKARFDR